MEALIPFPQKADRWPSAEQARYRTLLDRCDIETVIQHNYTAGCLQRRNRYLVDHASLLLSVYNGKGGGTLYTLTYALRTQRKVVILDV